MVIVVSDAENLETLLVVDRASKVIEKLVDNVRRRAGKAVLPGDCYVRCWGQLVLLTPVENRVGFVLGPAFVHLHLIERDCAFGDVLGALTRDLGLVSHPNERLIIDVQHEIVCLGNVVKRDFPLKVAMPELQWEHSWVS